MAMKAVTANLDEIREALKSARDTDRPRKAPSLREAVHTLLPEIEGLRKAKWSDAEISEWFGKRGMNISAGTLAQYVREARKSGNGRSAVRGTGRTSATVKDEAEAKTEGKASAAAGVPAKVDANAETGAKAKEETSAKPNAVPHVVPNAAGAAATKRRVNDDA